MARRRGRPIEVHKRLHTADSFTDITDGNDLLAMDYSGQVHTSTKCAKSRRQQRGDYFENKVKSKHRGALEDSSVEKVRDKSGYGGSCRESHGGQIRPPVAQSVTTVEQQPDINDEDGPVIPTDDIGEFVTMLMDGMRSDGEQLAESAKHVVANTFSVSKTPVIETREALPRVTWVYVKPREQQCNSLSRYELLKNSRRSICPLKFELDYRTYDYLRLRSQFIGIHTHDLRVRFKRPIFRTSFPHAQITFIISC